MKISLRPDSSGLIERTALIFLYRYCGIWDKSTCRERFQTVFWIPDQVGDDKGDVVRGFSPADSGHKCPHYITKDCRELSRPFPTSGSGDQIAFDFWKPAVTYNREIKNGGCKS